MSEDNIIKFDGEDPEMLAAYKNAQSTFKYFWRELSWEYRRIIPALEIAAAKVAFTNKSGEGPTEEHMWMNELEFNGQKLTGTLMNEPNWVTGVEPGQRIKFPLHKISDWMYAVYGKVYGAYTVNVMRAQMSRSERSGHDNAWGLDFGDPNEIEIFYKAQPKKSLFSFFKKSEPQVSDAEQMNQEHPMCINMAEAYGEQLQQSNEVLSQKDEHGNTMLHSDSLAGNALAVQLFLQHGADPTQPNSFGQTPMDLAMIFKWVNVAKVLKQ